MLDKTWPVVYPAAYQTFLKMLGLGDVLNSLPTWKLFAKFISTVDDSSR